MPETQPKSRHLRLALIALCAAIVATFGMGVHHEFSRGKACAVCHGIWQPHSDWHTSTHRNLACGACHTDVFTLRAGYHIGNMVRVFAHLRGSAPERVRLSTPEVFSVSGQCQGCHQKEWNAWASGVHYVAYKKIFLNSRHNQRTLLTDDCLRCHAALYGGGIRDLVTPLDTKGPWKLRDSSVAERPVVVCLNCHLLHHHGQPATMAPMSSAPAVPSLAVFDRPNMQPVALADLHLPAMREGDREVGMSHDARQALCYHCHAPAASQQVGSGADHTPRGVHEGISCLACHENHSLRARATCASCHPRLSNCGLNVETMDTTFKSRQSRHDIHTVKCTDCHAQGIPPKHQAHAPAVLRQSAG